MNQTLDEKNIIIMKLLHYFITEKNYNPIILQGVDNEIWLENLDGEYKIVRIVSNYIHNNEQLNFDIFKTRRLMNKIKKKTLSFRINTLSIFTDLGENVSLESVKDIDCIELKEENDLKKYKFVTEAFPDINNKLKFNEEGLELFLKITNEINDKNRIDAKKVEDVFSPKKPIVTYILIAINVIIFLMMFLFGYYDSFVDKFATYGPFIRGREEYYRLFTGAFLHADILHILFNSYALYIIGSQIENYFGKVKYLIIYIFSIFTASLLSITFNTNPSIGASGAIFGLIGSLLYFGYHYRIYLGNVLRSQIIPLVIFNLLIGFLYSGIDNSAHIGGLIGGALISVALGVKYKSTNTERINGIILSIIFTAFLVFMALIYKN